MTPPGIHRVTTLDLNVEPFAWPFAAERRGEIDAHFAGKRREKPEIWNGRVLLGRNAVHAGEHLRADFSRPILRVSWRGAIGVFRTQSVFNGFGMGALQSSDGAFLLGEMGSHTANAGRIYFPAGTPDPDDVRDGMLDLAGSIVREVTEETGLDAADYTMDTHWTCVFAGPSIAMIRILRVDMSGEALKARIEANLARETQPELCAIHLVRSRSDLVPVMPRFVSAFLEAQFSG